MDADIAALRPHVERKECRAKHVPPGPNPLLTKVIALIFLLSMIMLPLLLSINSEQNNEPNFYYVAGATPSKSSAAGQVAC